MNGLLVVTAVVGALAAGAVYVVPPRMSWAKRLRWAVSAHQMEPFGWGLCGLPSCVLRTVVLQSLEVRDGGLRVVVRGEASRIETTLVGVAPDEETLERLHEWQLLGTLMLHYVGNDGVGSLTGPAATITNLREEACVQSS
jgi:hypothetical protein